ISLGGIVVAQSIRVGGDELDEAIINYVKREHKLMIGNQTAEEVKLEIGSAYPLRGEVQAEIRGRGMVSGLPKTAVLSSADVRSALEEPLVQIVDAVKATLDKTPPELASDIMDRGIMLAGGGSLLQGLDERLRQETEMPIHVAESPLTCVAVGSGRALEEFEVMRQSQAAGKRPPGSQKESSPVRASAPASGPSAHRRRGRQLGPLAAADRRAPHRPGRAGAGLRPAVHRVLPRGRPGLPPRREGHGRLGRRAGAGRGGTGRAA